MAAAAVLALFDFAEAITEEIYTTNAICRQKHCINPIFPALEEFRKLEDMRWEKHELSKVQEHMEFCGDTIDYDVALPKNNGTLVKTPAELAMIQDDAASKMYFYHLNGMGLEPWEHPKPHEDSDHPLRDCARAVSRMVCFSYFPKAYHGLKDGQETAYMRPCKSSCQNYIKACDVDCCDDSVTCVFEKEVHEVHNSISYVQTGYVDALGPSVSCTGGSQPVAQVGALAASVALLVLMLGQ
eukprot:gnl/TRDRNA2_/TRDRNA2_37912_c0_seq1.p1 gnl/TRDRNA2_/TRDRNA2_37912_c0~~gnl/TRDRNA2_/TRDRNA2_37912_c0_seq1.p1  ORF type:complete len:274 (-),score=45.33 gnl/TRDRNA2_/TRDRNA2_37912_c0_seq1:84-806(-)